MHCRNAYKHKQRERKMAKLFINQAKEYHKVRPSYPSDLINFITSKTPNHDLAWDVGTGSGQAAVLLSNIYKNVVATDTSQQQLEYATKLPNIRYQQTPPTMSLSELTRDIARPSTVDLVTVAQSFHWLDHPKFYDQVKTVLKKPEGVLAVWCYLEPEVNEAVDAVYWELYRESTPYWAEQRKLVDDRYRSVDFPFEPIDGLKSTEPVKFMTEKTMDFDGYLTYIRSWSAYQTAKTEGVELLSKDVIEKFERAWATGDGDRRIVRFPVYLRIGRVGS